MIEISIPAYLVEVVPLFSIMFILQSLILFKRVKWTYILWTVTLVSSFSLFFNTFGEISAGIIMFLSLIHQRRYSAAVSLALLWDCYMIIVNLITLLTPAVSRTSHINNIQSSYYLSIGVCALLVLLVIFKLGAYRYRFQSFLHQLDDDTHLCQVFTVYSLIICGCLYAIELGSEFINFSIQVELLLMSIFLAILLVNIGTLYFLFSAINARANNRILQSAARDKAQYYADIELQQTRTRKIIHDYKNVLSSLQLSLDTPTTTAGESQTSQLITRAQAQLNGTEPSNSVLTSVLTTSLRGLLYLKWSQAHSKKILLNLQTSGSISINNNADLMDVLRIVGILIDNAIEACTASDDVNVLLTQTDKELAITVINKVASGFKLMKLNEVGYTTKGSGHGNGMGNIRELTRANHHLHLLKLLKENKLSITLSIEVN